MDVVPRRCCGAALWYFTHVVVMESRHGLVVASPCWTHVAVVEPRGVHGSAPSVVVEPGRFLEPRVAVEPRGAVEPHGAVEPRNSHGAASCSWKHFMGVEPRHYLRATAGP